MANNIDSYLGIHPAALKLRSQRTEMIANNLANADTPGFKARDLDFKSALAAAGSKDTSMSLATTRTGHIAVNDVQSALSGQQLYRVPLAPSLDGNTVDAQLEQSAFAENAVRYQASLNFLSSKFRALMTAITGQ